MQTRFIRLFIIALAVAVIVPQVIFASWYNPLSWGWLNRIFHFQQTTQKVQQPILVGGDKDVHGCLGSAGYSWCEKKNKCLRVWEEKCEILSDVYPTFLDLKWGDAVAKTISEPVTNVKIVGYEIKLEDKINNNIDASKFFQYYSKKLEKSSWRVDNYFAADGITGSQVGYNNGGNNIVLSYSIKPGKITSGQNEPLQWTCPCDVTYTIFTGQSEVGQCTKDSECPSQYKCINKTCQIGNETAGWKTYTNNQYGFSINYQSGVTIVAGVQSVLTPTIVSLISIPVLDYPLNGRLDIGISTNSEDYKYNCLVTPVDPHLDSSGWQNMGNIVINGITFLHFKYYQPATGQFQLIDTYRTIRNGACWNINLVQSGEESNRSVQSAAINLQIQNELNANLKTFKFTK